MNQALDLVEDPLIGSTVAGKYLIKSRVGGGAMGVVYEATQVALEKRVAIKVLNRELQTRLQFVGRFHVEAKAASLLDHANSTRVIDFGTDDSGLLYICMEFLEGQNLYEVIRVEWPLDPMRVADILSQTLAALAKAHDMGILHRDIKPDNIVIQRRVDDEGKESDVVKVCDFGIAKLEGVDVVELMAGGSISPGPMKVAGPALTNVGLIIGTPDYMSPEQARGELLDPRSDIYSVGVVLYHMLAGRQPFEGATAADILTKHISEEPVPPSSLSRVDPELEAICRRAMSKSPDDRYRTAREMRSALRRTQVFQRGHSDASAPLSTDTPMSVPTTELALTIPQMPAAKPAEPVPKRSRMVAVLTTLVVATLAIAVVFRAREPSKTAADAADAKGAAPQPLAASGPASAATGDGTSVGAIVRAAPSASASSFVSSADLIASAAMVDPIAPKPPPTATVAPLKPVALAPVLGSPAIVASTPAADSLPPAITATASAAAASPTAPTPTSEPTPTVVPPPPPPIALPPAAAPQFHPENGRVEVGKIETDRVTSRSINDVLRHTNLQRCYTDALLRAGQGRAGTAVVVLDIDQNRVERARFADTIGLPGLGACIQGQFAGARVADADTGSASANITLHFVGP